MLYDPDERMRNFGTIQQGIQQDAAFLIYEGLPDPMKRALYHHELNTKKTIMLHGSPFYEELPAFSPQAKYILTDLCADPETFIPNLKTLCAIHADYALEWRIDEDVTHMLICFTCGDMAGFRGDTQLVCHMAPLGKQWLHSLLFPYRKNRPEGS